MRGSFRSVGGTVNLGSSGKLTIPWRSAVERVHGWVLPPRCVLCLDPGRVPLLDLCPACLAELPAMPIACPRCAEPLHGAACVACAASGPPPYERALAAYRYAWPVDALVRGFKYHGQLAHGRVLGTLLAEAVLSAEVAPPDLIVPVPLHPERERERGYNQAWELARVAARRLGVRAAAEACRRVRHTAPQASLDAAARRANLAGAFVAPRPLPGARVAVVDDVLTTGATLGAVADALHAAGVAHVQVWTVARA
jgi:ComF family protein